MTDSSRLSLVSLIVLIVALVAIAAGLSVQTFMTARAISQMDNPAVERLLARLAWLSTVLLALTLVLLFWSVARLLRWSFGTHRRVGPTPYVDAWALAGERLKLPEEEDDEEDREDDERPGQET